MRTTAKEEPWHQIPPSQTTRPSSSSPPRRLPTMRWLLCYAAAASLHYAYHWTTILMASSPTKLGNPASSGELPSSSSSSKKLRLEPLPWTPSSSHGSTSQNNRTTALVTTWEAHQHRRATLLPSLDDLTRSATTTCPNGLVLLENRVAPSLLSPSSDGHRRHKIPRIVHQTSKSRCVTPAFAKAADRWKFANDDDRWSYYLHDDDAVQRLLVHHSESHFPEFPHLALVARRCLLHGTIRSDLWRYLVLWAYGGVYADLDAVPNALHLPEYLADQPDGDPAANGTSTASSSREPPPDALFVVEQFHLLSQYFMAVSPRHPLMYYAVQHSLMHLLLQPDTGAIPAALVTGPHALHRALTSFVGDAGGTVDPAVKDYKPVREGTYFGTRNRTVTAIGKAEDQNHYVDRDAIGPAKKRLEYQRMGMRHFQDDKKHATGQSCVSALMEGHYYDGD